MRLVHSVLSSTSSSATVSAAAGTQSVSVECDFAVSRCQAVLNDLQQLRITHQAVVSRLASLTSHRQHATTPTEVNVKLLSRACVQVLHVPNGISLLDAMFQAFEACVSHFRQRNILII
jgi:hypothetical protein